MSGIPHNPGAFSRSFDLFRHKRVSREFTEPSTLGALVSLLGVIVLVLCGALETISFFAVKPTE